MAIIIMRSSEAGQPRGAALALLHATERLMAERGMANVSLRQITEAAGAGNASAIQYHFGSREELMAAIFRYRSGTADGRRLDHLAVLDAPAQADDQRQLIGALVYPLVAEFEPREEGNYYLRFTERWLRDHGVADGILPVPIAPGWVEVEQRLEWTLGYLPPEVIAFRIFRLREQVIIGLAWIEAGLEQFRARGTLALQVELLIDTIVAMLSGSISNEALRLISPAADTQARRRARPA
jgi:AcrR family transcriptional regulator